MTRIEDIKERESKATEGPWWYDHVSADPEIGDKRDWTVVHQVCSGVDDNDDSGKLNASFITHSRTDIPYLLKGMEAARPVMEWAADNYCAGCRDGRELFCSHAQARAWKKEYYPEEKS